jgi:hypothetical protein
VPNSGTSQLFQAVPYRYFGSGADTFLVNVPSAGQRHLLHSITMKVLRLWTAPQTIEQLIHCVAEQIVPRITENELRATIRQILDLHLVTAVAPTFDSPSGVDVTSLTVLTCDRPTLLRRALSSYSQSIARYNRDVEIIVLDDSKSGDGTRSTIQVVKTANTSRLRYAGRVEKQRYVNLLAAEGINPISTRLALMPELGLAISSVGANRNCALLDTIGQAIIQIDDDTSCEIVGHPDRQATTHYTRNANPRETWFFQNQQELRKNIIWERIDLIGEHSSVLGSAVDHIRTDIRNSDFTIRGSNRKSFIVATISGVVGDVGSPTALFVLSATGPTRTRLAADPSLFDVAVSSRHVLSVVPAITVTRPRLFAGATMGLLNSYNLPPFFPIGDGEDNLFGMTLGLLSPHNLVAHIPYAVFHGPPENRTYDLLPRFGITELMTSILSYFSSQDGSESIRTVTNEILELTKLSDTQFWGLVSEAISLRRARHLKSLEVWLRDFEECPEVWRNRLLQYHSNFCTTMVERTTPVPFDFVQDFGQEYGKTKVRDLVQEFGNLLRIWPAILEAARHLKMNGVRLSRGLA